MSYLELLFLCAEAETYRNTFFLKMRCWEWAARGLQCEDRERQGCCQRGWCKVAKSFITFQHLSLQQRVVELSEGMKLKNIQACSRVRRRSTDDQTGTNSQYWELSAWLWMERRLCTHCDSTHLFMCRLRDNSNIKMQKQLSHNRAYEVAACQQDFDYFN